MELIGFLILIALSFLCTPGVLFKVSVRESKMAVAFVHAMLFSALYFTYDFIANRYTEGFTQNGDPDYVYKKEFDKCITVNSPPFIGSASDTINYCLNRISSRFVK